ncbi:MAG: 2Fe-2S iron-sulfur cluster-binding protein [Spongiibacteraceae bacterium]
MPRVTYIEHNGTTHSVEITNGASVMQGAIDNAISGIVAECGGALACATCHCLVDEAWIDKAGTPSEAELQMLEFSAGGIQEGSRLSCQLIVNNGLDGLIVRLPESQY